MLKKFAQLLKDKIAVLEKAYPFASAFLQSTKSLSVTSSTKNESISFNLGNRGGVIKVFNGLSFYEKAFSPVDEQSINRAVKYLMDLKSEVDKDSSLSIDPGETMEKDFHHNMEIDPSSINEKEMLSRAKENREYIESKSSHIVDASNMLGYLQTEELYINRNKTLFQRLHRFDNIFSTMFSNGSSTSDIFGGHSRIGGYEHANLDEGVVASCISDGEAILSSSRLKPGLYNCILSPSMSGMLAHEAFGHGTEADMFLKKRAKGADFIGKQVAAKGVNMWDNPALNDQANGSGSYFFDHEGQLAKGTKIIEDGILISGITDLYSATRLGIKRTPNGRSESYANKVYARMSNTYFEGGTDNLEDMIKSIDYGYYIDHATNGMEDPKGWGMQLEALYAREIVDGKFTDRIFSPVILTGYVPDVLKSISGISKDFQIHSMGYCGKGHKEWVKVTDGGPHLKLKARLA